MRIVKEKVSAFFRGIVNRIGGFFFHLRSCDIRSKVRVYGIKDGERDQDDIVFFDNDKLAVIVPFNDYDYFSSLAPCALIVRINVPELVDETICEKTIQITGVTTNEIECIFDNLSPVKLRHLLVVRAYLSKNNVQILIGARELRVLSKQDIVDSIEIEHASLITSYRNQRLQTTDVITSADYILPNIILSGNDPHLHKYDQFRLHLDLIQVVNERVVSPPIDTFSELVSHFLTQQDPIAIDIADNPKIGLGMWQIRISLYDTDQCMRVLHHLRFKVLSLKDIVDSAELTIGVVGIKSNGEQVSIQRFIPADEICEVIVVAYYNTPYIMYKSNIKKSITLSASLGDVTEDLCEQVPVGQPVALSIRIPRANGELSYIVREHADSDPKVQNTCQIAVRPSITDTEGQLCVKEPRPNEGEAEFIMNQAKVKV